MFVVAHISDLHFNGTEYNRSRNEAAVEYINQYSVGIDALLITGDIADTGAPEQYEEFVSTVTSDLPTLTTIGNHDDLQTYRDVVGLPENSILDVPNRSGDSHNLRIIAVDSSIPDSAGGYLSDATLAFVDAAIGEVDSATSILLAFHHPPVVLHMPVMDVIRQTGEDRLIDLVAAHPNIVGLLCGHAHTPAVTRFAGRPLCLAPGVSSTLNLPFEGSGVVNVSQPPSIAFHLLDDERLTTHFRVATPKS
ncbi:putative phosphodiesterase [Gordonia effusa NBRC 100432]|uniref:Putative phosphodiesterase n=1 Tax=Gordonia effusa NBRC 100432 TaxID=1077974 RepID=H0R189_9ACTN|nr:metallophosphoesterase [Gordonia effusa]GAB18840.1 putative phosphodiesterase [Gordonia effusa NBRC 100432]